MRLVLIRHGESEWTHEGRFTGWSNVNLSQDGLDTMRQAAQKLSKFRFSHIYASALRRSIDSAEIIRQVSHCEDVPIETTWRLNERHYGALEGLNKKETSLKYGEDQVRAWRRGYNTRPPQVDEHDPRHPRQDSKYKNVADEVVPGESPADCFKRVHVWFAAQKWPPDALILVCAHGTSLRVIMQIVESLTNDEIEKYEIPSAVPLVYELDKNHHMLSKQVLMDPAEFAERQKEITDQASPTK